MWEKPGSTRSFNKIVQHHALPTCHAETLIDDPNRIDAPTAHHTIALPVLSRSGPVSTIRARSRICCPHLPVVQQAGAACTLAVGQPIGTFFVKPMHPVPQCQSLNASPSMSGGPFRQSAPPPFASVSNCGDFGGHFWLTHHSVGSGCVPWISARPRLRETLRCGTAMPAPSYSLTTQF